MEITAAMVRRYQRGETSLYAPCIICGGKFNLSGKGEGTCGHTVDDTAPLIKRIKGLGPKERERIIKEEK